MNIAILGAGTYGSYAAHALCERFPEAEITLYDVGQKGVKSEADMGLRSVLKGDRYTGLTDGRYFGLGGTSDKWGGQLLTFTDNDFAHPDAFMRDVVRIDQARRDSMLARFGIENRYAERHLTPRLFTKTGVWLSALHRNFYYWFRLHRRRQITLRKHCRVVRLESRNGRHIDAVVYLHDGKEHRAVHDRYFLTAGAFESARILLSSGFIAGGQVPFSDHLSMQVFRVKGSTMIGDEDFVFRMRGTSLITKRMIGEVNDVSYYVHPVFNLRFPFFEVIKEGLFKHHFEWRYVGIALRDVPHALGFAWTVLVRRRMYVLNDEWYLNIDIENPTRRSHVALSAQTDAFGLPALDVTYEVGAEAAGVFQQAKADAMAHLDATGTVYETLVEQINVRNSEDIYHPYAMFAFRDADDYFTRWDNMLMVNTGCLSRIGGINPTGALLPLVDEYIERRLGGAGRQ